MIVVGNSSSKGFQPVSIDIGNTSGKLVKAERVMVGDSNGKAKEVWSGSKGYLIRLVGSLDESTSTSTNYWVATDYSSDYGKTWTRVTSGIPSNKTLWAGTHVVGYSMNIIVWIWDKLIMFPYESLGTGFYYNPSPKGDGAWTYVYTSDQLASRMRYNPIFKNGLIFGNAVDYRNPESETDYYFRCSANIYDANKSYARILNLFNTEYQRNDTSKSTYGYSTGFDFAEQISENIYVCSYFSVKFNYSTYDEISSVHYVCVVYLKDGISSVKVIETYTDTDLSYSGSGKLYSYKCYKFKDGVIYTFVDQNSYSYSSTTMTYKKVSAEYSNGTLNVSLTDITVNDATLIDNNPHVVQFHRGTYEKDGKYYYAYQSREGSGTAKYYYLVYKTNINDSATVVRGVGFSSLALSALSGKYFYYKDSSTKNIIAFDGKTEFSIGMSNLTNKVISNMTFVTGD